MPELVFLLEEPSARNLLQGLLPRILPKQWDCKFIVFEGKQDLEKRMGRKLRAWLTPDTKFVVLRDQDHGDCKSVKAGLVSRCKIANKPDSLVRVACHELEAWIVGDLSLFADEFSCPQASRQMNKSKYNDPDSLPNPVSELLTLYPDYRKGEGARRMGLRLDPTTNCSRSFIVFCSGVRRLTDSLS